MSGLWDRPEIPHKDWVCIAVEDLEQASERCEMCGNEGIRYVHTMWHETYPKELLVGCVCAEKMEMEYEISPQQREAGLKSRANRRSRWLTRNWRLSNNDNEYLKSDGYIFLIAQKYGKFRAVWKNQDYEDWHNLPKFYATAAEAKLALFDDRYPRRIKCG